MDEQKKAGKQKIFNYLRVGFVLVAVLAAIIWACGRQNDVPRYVILWQSFVKMGPWFFAGIIAAFVLSQVILASRWWLLLRSQGVRINIWAAVRLHFLGLFYNNCIPGSVGGDLVRAWYVTKHTEKKFEAALSVFVDRFVALLSSLVMAGFCWFVLLDVKIPSGEKKTFSKIILFVIIGIVILAGLIAILPAGRRLYSKAYRAGLSMARKFWSAAVIYGRNPLTIFACFCLTILLQSIVITGFWLIGRQIGIGASLKYYFVFFPLTWGFGAIPVSIGGAGVVEFGLAGLFSFVGVESGQGFALALLQRAVWIIASLPGAWIHWTGRHLPKEEAIDYTEEVN
jgi:glycosyltransferase 2 family protein